MADVTGKGVSAALADGQPAPNGAAFLHTCLRMGRSIRINRLIVDSTPQGISISLLIVKLYANGDVEYANARATLFHW